MTNDHYTSFLIAFFLLFSLSTFAQQGNWKGKGGTKVEITLKGKVLNETTKAPLDYATVSLYKEDKTLADGTITDEKGRFSIVTQPGRYYIEVEFLSYNKKTITDIVLTKEKQWVDLGDILLTENSMMLEEVEVVAEKSQMELKLDKRVFNVGKDLANTGNNASEILENVPSVSVDVDGNVSLRGSENVRILIDGKPSGLVGISGTDALKQMQGDMIQSVEVITNPSARYDAEGEVGIINIVLKKGKKKGVNGSFSLTAGYPENFGASYSLNLRRKQFNFFSNFGVNYRNGPGNGYNYQDFYNNGLLDSRSEVDRTHERGGLSGNIQLGTDWYINEQNILTASILTKYSAGDNLATVTYNDFDAGLNLLNRTVRINDEEETKINGEAALSYQRLFTTEEHKLTVDFKYIQGDDTEIGTYDETSTTVNPIFQRSESSEDQVNWFVQTDYVHPLGKDGKFEAGLKASVRTIQNDFKVENFLGENNWEVVPDFFNKLRYDENIYAAYLMYGNKWNNISYQFGLRTEYSDITTALLLTNEVNPRTYLNWFPSAHFTYELSETDQFQVSYSRRLSRPRFWYLLPFFTYSDNRNLFTGNPDLDPEYTDSYEVGYLKYFEKGSFLSSVYYRYRTGVIERVTSINANGTTLRLPINLSSQDAYGVEMNISYELLKWWKLNANFNFYRAISEGLYEGQTLTSDTYTWQTRANSRMTILKDITFQTSFNYRAPNETTQGRTLAFYSVDTGLSKDILKGKGTLTFSVKDVFNTRKWRSITDLPETYYAESSFQWRARQFLLTFNYRLNQKKSRGRPGGNYQGGGGGIGF